MKRIDKTHVLALVLSVLNIGIGWADNLPIQPGDPGMSTPVDSGVLLAILGFAGVGVAFFKNLKKKK